MNPPELLGVLAESFAGTDACRTLPMRLCAACVDTFGAQGGALTVLAGPGDQVAVSTPGEYEQLEPLQEVLGEGPVPRAIGEDRLVALCLGDVVDEYPVFSHLAGSVSGDATAEATLYAVPMRVSPRVVGALSVYVTGDLAARAPDLQLVADAVGTILLRRTTLGDWSEKASFHQATGMVAAEFGIRPDDASAMIRAHAFARSTSLLEVADDVLARRRFPGDG
ncbi:GAF domain-containing protein [Promicromonospora sukumoe]|uniref:ANTAR domain-containing protein n=1 Tax=Promicromonospora sukumoe TaxID=88382 RepID=A0A7W3J8S6_9MICO|nr:ANTAR domain-containing protein [Promicromonospora sukumoe]MBA8808387.1 hypothetical protein [Promicromonospora sukumoe]